jgi:hypothetical protein
MVKLFAEVQILVLDKSAFFRGVLLPLSTNQDELIGSNGLLTIDNNMVVDYINFSELLLQRRNIIVCGFSTT